MSGGAYIGRALHVRIGQWLVLSGIRHYYGCVVRELPVGDWFKERLTFYP
jgi:hypothetical protein